MSSPACDIDALRLANRVHALLTATGDEAAAERITAEAARWQATSTRIVVAGDINRGKTSLVNALLDDPDLLPVDVDVTTAVDVAVGFARPPVTRITRIDPDSGEATSTPIDPDDLAAHVVAPPPGSTGPTVVGAEVLVDHPLVESGLTLVDTPGVGGMSRGHRDATMAALAHADAMIFVVSAVEPVTRSELEFLDAASERISNVTVVASRADLGTPEVTAAILAELRDKIERLADLRDESGASAAAARLRRIAGSEPIRASSYLASQAARRAERGRTEQARIYRERSGIDEIVARIEATRAARDDVRLANLLQLLTTLLAPAVTAAADRLRVLDGDPDVARELEARRADLERASSQQARWRGTLGTGISRMQTTIGRDVSRELTLVRDHYRNLLDAAGNDVDLDALAVELRHSLQAAWINLADHAARQFDEVIGSLLDDLAIDGEAGVLGELAQPPALASLQTRSGFEDRFGLLDDAVPLATQAFLFGNIANVMVGVMGLATGGLGLLAYGIGAGIAAPVVMLRRRQREQRRRIGETQRALNEALFGQEGLARELSTELTLRVMDVRSELEQLIDERLTARRKDLETQLRELHELLRAETSERAAMRDATAHRLRELQVLAEDTRRLDTAVDARLVARVTGEDTPADAVTP